MAKRYYALAAALAAIGILGFVLPTPMLGTFETTAALNGLHLAAAVLTAVAAARGLGTMRAWGQMLGYVFAALSIAAFAAGPELVGGLLPLSTSNAGFHLLLALIFLYHALLAPPS
jgi:hypothetical protein